MARSMAQLKHPLAKVVGDFDEDQSFLISVRIDEGLSKITETRIVFGIKDSELKLEKLLGKPIRVELKTQQDTPRKFLGTCIEAEYLGLERGFAMFAVETRPWLWFLTRSSNNRIFQEKTIPAIVKQVCDDLGFTQCEDTKLTGKYASRPYVVQYNETDHDFICRLMEEEGIYFYFDHSGEVEKMVLADDVGAHKPLPATPEVAFKPWTVNGRREVDTVFEWGDRELAVSGKVSLRTMEFTTSNTKLGVTSIIKRGSHAHNDLERYSMDGHYSKVAEGETYARVAAERAACQAARWVGAANVRTMAPGFHFTLKDHPRVTTDKEFLLVACTHYLQIDVDPEAEKEAGDELEQFITQQRMNFPDMKELYLVEFEAIRKTEQFRPPAVTVWPKMSGVHRGVVVGPKDQEIYVDEYGRIRVFFYWDRRWDSGDAGEPDETASCWIRVAQPFGGKGYGTMFIPRIGNEVLIAFERDDPNYPICIGSVYNDLQTVPYKLADNMTQTAIKTKSTKKGDENNFHELVFEDKIGEEFIRLQSEKDWFEKIKNNAVITVGMETQDAGDMTLTVYNSLTETLKEGDHTLTIEKGKEDITIEGDHTTTIKSGNHTTNVDTGNHVLKVKTGNQTTEIDSGKMTVKAATSIELIVGGSSIKIEPAQITIKSGTINIEATTSLTAKSDLSALFKGGSDATLDGGGMTTIKGGQVLIN